VSILRVHSSFAGADWLPVLESLVRGTQHSLNNRIAALDGVISLQEMGLASQDESQMRLRAEMERIKQLLHLMRELAPKTTLRREPGRIGDALRVAGDLLSHRADSRQVSFAPGLGEEPADAEPVILWPADRLRAMVLLLIAASEAAVPGSILRVTIRGDDHLVRVTVAGAISPTEAETSPVYQALVRFAETEEGSCVCETDASGTASALLTLTLPGMNG